MFADISAPFYDYFKYFSYKLLHYQATRGVWPIEGDEDGGSSSQGLMMVV